MVIEAITMMLFEGKVKQLLLHIHVTRTDRKKHIEQHREDSERLEKPIKREKSKIICNKEQKKSKPNKGTNGTKSEARTKSL